MLTTKWIWSFVPICLLWCSHQRVPHFITASVTLGDNSIKYRHWAKIEHGSSWESFWTHAQSTFWYVTPLLKTMLLPVTLNTVWWKLSHQPLAGFWLNYQENIYLMWNWPHCFNLLKTLDNSKVHESFTYSKQYHILQEWFGCHLI